MGIELSGVVVIILLTRATIPDPLGHPVHYMQRKVEVEDEGQSAPSSSRTLTRSHSVMKQSQGVPMIGTILNLPPVTDLVQESSVETAQILTVLPKGRKQNKSSTNPRKWHFKIIYLLRKSFLVRCNLQIKTEKSKHMDLGVIV